MFFSSLEPIDEVLYSSSGVLTPHCFTPISDAKKPGDLDFSRFGSFNLGFIGLRKCDLSFSFLKWWRDRLSQYGFYDPQSGMAVDQKWMDLAVVYFKGFKIIDHLGCNLAFWNLHERRISKRDGIFYVNDNTALIFVHFSSYVQNNTKAIADKQDRFEVGSRPDFELLSIEYNKLLVQFNSRLNELPYEYEYFKDGGRISNTLRRIYANYEDHFFEENVFSSKSKIYKFAKTNGLISKGLIKRNNFKTINSFFKFQKAFIFILRCMLKLLGPDRYYMLMRYLAYVSSIHNQKAMFKVDKDVI